MSRRQKAPHGAPQAYLAGVPATGEGCLTWPFGCTSSGYATINVNRKTTLVSRLLCERSHGPAPTPAHQAAHSCGRGHEACIAPWHLSWKTPKDNHADQYEHGTRVQAERHPMTRLSGATVREMRLRAQAGDSQASIARAYGVSRSRVSSIVRRVTWSSVA